jgi:hypothetical protein
MTGCGGAAAAQVLTAKIDIVTRERADKTPDRMFKRRYLGLS